MLCYKHSTVNSLYRLCNKHSTHHNIFIQLFIPLGSAPLPECTRATFRTPFWHCHVLTLSLFETGSKKGGQSGAIGAPVRLID